jgi:hypothetical protein
VGGLSSPAQAQAKESRAGRVKTEPKAWYAPPPDTPLYAAVPTTAPTVDDAHSGIQIRILDLLRSPKYDAKQNEDKSWTCQKAPPYEKLAAVLRVSKSTVWRAFKLDSGLIAKKTIQCYAVYSREGSKRRVSTHYYIPPYEEILKARRAIPDIALTKGGHPIVIGRRRRLVLQPEAKQWGFRPELAPASPRQAAKLEREKAYSVTHSKPKGTVMAEMPATHKPDVAAVLARLLAAARNVAPAIPIEAVIGEIDSIHQRKVALQRKAGDRRPLTAGWFLHRMPSHVEHWKTAEQARAREHERAARFARDQRINTLIEGLGWIARSQGRTAPEDVEMREMWEHVLATADPDELSQAQDVARRRA